MKRFVGAVHRYQLIEFAQWADIYVRVLTSQVSSKSIVGVLFTAFGDFFRLIKLSQQTFQRRFNVVFWLMRRRDVGQRQINVETLCISTSKCTTSSNVESTLCISTLT